MSRVLTSILLSLVSLSPAWADARTVAYLQGAAFGIAANCPSLRLDVNAIAATKNGINGVRQGSAKDFAEGVFNFHNLLNGTSSGECGDSGPCTCKNVCNFRPGTCYFLKEKSSAARRHGISSGILVSQFSEYFVSKSYDGKGARPVLSTPEAAEFRTRLTEAAFGKSNFSGHYVIAQWGCGTECVMGAAIDSVTGRVVFFPFNSVCCWGAVTEGFEPIQFRLNSRLIVFLGQLNDQGPLGAHYFSFEDDQFKSLTTVPLDDTNFAH